jgi:hypothetical protein
MNDRHWLEFLDRIATEEDLSITQAETLRAKFPAVNLMANDKDLVKQLYVEDATPRLRKLYQAFDCLQKIEGKGKAIALRKEINDRYKQEQEALVRSTEAPTKDELWSQLKELGDYSPRRMGIYQKPQIDISNMGGAFEEEDLPKRFLDTVPKGTERLKFQILSEGRGKVLLLLNREESGKIYCVCPSILTPSIEFDLGGEMIVPQPEAPKPYLRIPTTAGKEDWWAWIVNEEPSSLDWWEKMRNNRGSLLTNQQLADLLRLAGRQGEVLHTYYWVVENNH